MLLTVWTCFLSPPLLTRAKDFRGRPIVLLQGTNSQRGQINTCVAYRHAAARGKTRSGMQALDSQSISTKCYAESDGVALKFWGWKGENFKRLTKKKRAFAPWARSSLMQGKRWKWILVSFPGSSGTWMSPLYLGMWWIIHAHRVYLFWDFSEGKKS